MRRAVRAGPQSRAWLEARLSSSVAEHPTEKGTTLPGPRAKQVPKLVTSLWMTDGPFTLAVGWVANGFSCPTYYPASGQRVSHWP